ncbi:MAG: class I SAM-dependent methyltransferase [Halieaceae bacterium]
MARGRRHSEVARRGTAVDIDSIESPLLAIYAEAPELSDQALELSKQLGLPLVSGAAKAVDCADAQVVLSVTEHGLLLRETGRNAPGPVAIEFGSKAMRHRRRGGHNELLGKAVGVGRKPTLKVIDATAGLGRDAFVLADLGCRVVLCEREPILVAMLQSALHRAQFSADDWLAEVTARMQLLPGDMLSQPSENLQGADVIYLDPMFPKRDKQAAVKKEMALFQRILPAIDDRVAGASLFDRAMSLEPARVVVKRPRKAPTLTSAVPSHVVQGKAVRYDVYVLKALS